MGCYKFASPCYEYPKGRIEYINQILSLNVFGISLGKKKGKISRIPMFTKQILIALSYIPENAGDAKLNMT